MDHSFSNHSLITGQSVNFQLLLVTVQLSAAHIHLCHILNYIMLFHKERVPDLYYSIKEYKYFQGCLYTSQSCFLERFYHPPAGYKTAHFIASSPAQSTPIFFFFFANLIVENGLPLWGKLHFF